MNKNIDVTRKEKYVIKIYKKALEYQFKNLLMQLIETNPQYINISKPRGFKLKTKLRP